MARPIGAVMSRAKRFWAALTWAILVLVSLLYVCLWAQNNRPDFDLLDLLPENQVVSADEKWLQEALSKEHKDTVTLAIALPDENEETLNSVHDVVDIWSKRTALFEKLDETAMGLPLLDQIRALAQGQVTLRTTRRFLSALQPMPPHPLMLLFFPLPRIPWGCKVPGLGIGSINGMCILKTAFF